MEAVKKIASVSIDEITDLNQFCENPRAWLEKQPATGPETWLLAYADDGVIWGRMENNRLLLASDEGIFDGQFPPLAYETLQRLYLFGEEAELHVWKNGAEIKAARVEDGPDVAGHSVDTALVLWGTAVVAEPKQGFTLLEDGAQGLRHAVPVKVEKALYLSEGGGGPMKRPIRLVVRQYLDYREETGEAYITATRMIRLGVEKD